jgi:PilZ domain-containing protein
VSSSSDKSGARRLEERRREARYTLILRVGVLEQAGRSALCLVKNISSAGVQVKFYSKPAVDHPVALRVADEPPVHGRIVWVEGDVAGISFASELDGPTLLRVQQKLRPNRRRTMPRVNVEAGATVRTGGRTCRAIVSDISSLGARLRTRSPLAMGNRAIVSLDDLPAINAYVRWSDGGESGLAFETAIPMQIIASWIDGRIRVNP